MNAVHRPFQGKPKAGLSGPAFQIEYIPSDIYLDIRIDWYILADILHNIGKEVCMDKAKIFINGRSQAIRLPRAYRFEGKEVYIKRISEGVLLIPKDKSIWDVWEENLKKYKTAFMTDRNQPKSQQERIGLDELFD